MSEKQPLSRPGRIEWIDMAKGIAMLLVVVGHTIPSSGQSLPLSLTRGLIFSFHMPLFFMLSMITYKCSDSGEALVRKTEKAFKHLIIPAGVLFILRTLWSVISDGNDEPIGTFFAKTLNAAVYASAGATKVGGESIRSVGMLWFFVVFFLGKTLYDYWHLKLKKPTLAIVVCASSIVGAGLSNIQHLPFSFDIVLTVMPLFAVGEVLKQIDLKKRPLTYGALSLGVWLIAFWPEFALKDSYLDLAMRHYPLYPLCLVAAAAGVVFVSCLSIVLLKLGKVMAPIVFIGRHSMYFFWVHIMDLVFRPVWNIPGHPLWSLAIRLPLDIVLFIAVVGVVYLVRRLRRWQETKKATS